MIVSLEERGPVDPSPGLSALPLASMTHPHDAHMDHAGWSQPRGVQNDGYPGYLPALNLQQEHQLLQHPGSMQPQSYLPRQQQQQQQQQSHDTGQQQPAGAPSAEAMQFCSHQPLHHVAIGTPQQQALEDDGCTESTNKLQHNQHAQADQRSSMGPATHASGPQDQLVNMQSSPEGSSAISGRSHLPGHPKAGPVGPQGSSHNEEGSQHLGAMPGPWYADQSGQLSSDMESSETPAAAMTGSGPGPAAAPAVILNPGAPCVLGMAPIAANSNTAEVRSLLEPRDYASGQRSIPQASPAEAPLSCSAPESGSSEPFAGQQLGGRQAGGSSLDMQAVSGPAGHVRAQAGPTPGSRLDQNGVLSIQTRSPEHKAALDVLTANVSSLDAAQQPSSPR